MNSYVDSISQRNPRTSMREIDLSLLCIVGTLLIMGLIMVFSSSIALGDGPKYVNAGRYYFFSRQLIFILIGLFAMAFTFLMPMKFWDSKAFWGYCICFLLLALVLVPGIGREVNYAYRWIPIGPFNFQPSEFAKLTMIVFTSAYTVRKQKSIHGLKGFLPIIIYLGIICFLLINEPDLGATMVVVAIVMSILLLGGLGFALFSLLFLSAVLLVIAAILTAPWRMQRFFAYLDPFSQEHAQNTGYQLTHSLIAVGRGGFFGEGLGLSIEKLHYLPEAHTDFIMAVVGEELGFVGIFFVILLFVLLVRKGLNVGRQAIAMDRLFNGLVAQGVVVWFGVQAIVNLGVCFGVFPTKGLTLPFISYGGSSIVISLMAFGLLLRVDYENRCLMRGQKPLGIGASYA
ncbi:putative lipid II flippase FtsW [Taylorella equigenitalis]|nr:putative lipid II flippase FtsW [Taylorella equigenitalis]AFN36353.1 cell division protein FtsW [Taylorella equigenitalis ATCC 35865]ASY30923.1 cell division protein FtsW [Taylorella equigenitalis]ASY38228.1 putative lipid II flippase FtsW [Taylorella equigenitalis]ASY39756.1 cell division protein FtsW [Taylorella equigenitalis]ASY41200.1 cell division protein FtsW [Taylorella equigenitalis]